MLHDQLSVSGLLNNLSFIIIRCDRCCEKEALLSGELVIRRVSAFDCVHDDGDISAQVENHDLSVQKNGRADQDCVREDRSHVAIVVVAIIVAEPQAGLLDILVKTFELFAEVGCLPLRAVCFH